MSKNNIQTMNNTKIETVDNTIVKDTCKKRK